MRKLLLSLGVLVGLSLLLVGCLATPPLPEARGLGGGLVNPPAFGSLTENITTTGSIAAGGGFGSTGCTMSAAGALSCDGAAILGSTLTVTGATTFQNLMTVNANGDFDSLSVAGASDLTSILNTGANPITISDDLVVTGTTTLNGTATIGDGGDTVAVNSSDWDIDATGNASGLGTISSDGLASVGSFFTGGNAAVAGNVLITGTVDIPANGLAWEDVSKLGSTLNDLETLSAAKPVAISDSLSVSGTLVVTDTTALLGALAANGGLSVDAAAFSVADTTGNTIISGTLTVTDTATFNGTLAAVGALTVGGGAGDSGCTFSDAGAVVCNGALDVDGAATITGTTTLNGAATIGDNGDTVAINSSDWDIDATGAMTGIGAITSDGAWFTSSTIGATGAITGSTGATIGGGDVTISPDVTGGNAGAINQLIGVPRLDLVGLGEMADGTANTVLTDIGDSETPATDWTGVTAGTSITVSNDTVRYRQGTASLKVEIGIDAVAGEGITNTLATGDQDWTDDEAFGFWFSTSTALDAGDLVLWISDATPAEGYTAVNVPAATADAWQWLELDVTLANNNLKDVITGINFALSAAGQAKAAAGAFQVNFDFIVKWDTADEETLGHNIYQDGVVSFLTIEMTNGAAATANPVLYTDYFVHYKAGNDAIVPISDLADTDKIGLALVAYQ